MRKRTRVIHSNRINREIHVSEVRLANVDGRQIGIVSLNKALEIAEKENLDLVEINANINPPICRIMDYGKFIYEKNKSFKEQRKKQKIIHIKEIKFRPSTEESDYQIKLRNLLRFLEEGNKVKVTLRFRGREILHQDIGITLLNRIRNDIKKIFLVESTINKVEGRQMIMFLMPKKNKNLKK